MNENPLQGCNPKAEYVAIDCPICTMSFTAPVNQLTCVCPNIRNHAADNQRIMDKYLKDANDECTRLNAEVDWLKVENADVRLINAMQEEKMRVARANGANL